MKKDILALIKISHAPAQVAEIFRPAHKPHLFL